MKNSLKCRFENIKVGDCFLFGGKLHVKINNSVFPEDNAFCFSTKIMYSYHQFTSIAPKQLMLQEIESSDE